ncbi:hypothetical protein [Ottowia sp.]|uniref:hypothetical protein n=1 Tax=Ottowia sp. TaxID=1898956 RepID=UPI003A865205
MIESVKPNNHATLQLFYVATPEVTARHAINLRAALACLHNDRPEHQAAKKTTQISEKALFSLGGVLFIQ